jgi:hypothetical protein
MFSLMVQETKKIGKNQNQTFYGNWGNLLVLLENFWWMVFLGRKFINFRPKVGDIELRINFVTIN